MSEESKEESKVSKQRPQPKKFGKAAHLYYASGANERLLLDVLLEDKKQYTKTEVQKIVKDWKQKEVKA